MLIGQKGVKYGLTVRKPDGAKGGKPAAAPAKKKQSVFGGDDDSDEDPQQNVEAQIARQAARKQADKKVADLHAAALAEDPSIFDYDAHYDDIQASRVEPKRQEKVERQSKYIASLLEKAEERKREQSILYERQLAKERAAEDHLFGDKERFVTAAYRKKLEEDQKWLAEEKLKKEQEEREAVEKKGHMGDFYRNLFKQNVAFGAKPGGKPKQGEQAQQAEQQEGGAAEEEEPVEPDWDAPDSIVLAGPAGGADAAERGSAKPAAAARDAAGAERGESGGGGSGDAGWEAARAARAARAGGEPGARQPEEQPAAAAAAAARGEARQEEAPAAAAAAPAGEAGEPAQQAPAAEAGQRRNREDAIAAARERYLARKRKAGQD